MSDLERNQMAEALGQAFWLGFKDSPFITITERDAESVARTLLPAVAEMLAAAWDEGHRIGWGDARTSPVSDGWVDPKVTPNPYRGA